MMGTRNSHTSLRRNPPRADVREQASGRYGNATRAIAALLLAAFTFEPRATHAQADHGFRFVRVQFDDVVPWSRGRGPWAHDHPIAELNLHEALRRTTKIHVEGPPVVLRLDDERIYEHPVLYLCEPGFWDMSDEEADNLAEYLRRGGFILFDDFRDEREWRHFRDQMRRVLPDREPEPVPPDHAIWNIHFEIDPETAPSLVAGAQAPYEAEYYAYFDDDGRMMVMVCFNQDIGEGWEWPNRNVNQGSTIAFQMGINFLIYAFTH